MLAVAGRQPDGRVVVLRQEIVRSTHAHRQANMRLFADRAANLATQVILEATNEEFPDLNDESSAEKTDDQNSELSFQPALLQLNRATHLRSDPVAIAELESARATQYVILRGNRILVKQSSLSPELALLSGDEMRDLTGGKSTRATFLGIVATEQHQQEHAIFGVDLLEDGDNVDSDDSKSMLDKNLCLVDTRTTAPLFSPLHNELA